jgi:pilus assembly protein Flp/PilA
MLNMILAHVQSMREREEGQALVEYALILVLVSIASIGTLTILGGDVSAIFTTVSDALGAA